MYVYFTASKPAVCPCSAPTTRPNIKLVARVSGQTLLPVSLGVRTPAAAALQMCALFNSQDIVPETLADDDEELPTDPSADRLAMVRSVACCADGMCTNAYADSSI